MSNSDVVIRVDGLGKKYALHHESSERYTALRDVVAHQAKAAGRLLNPFTMAGQLRRAQRQSADVSEEEFWALKDVNFEICRGERVGIIGRNGAGKSTLLKILSRITEPTTGRVEIRGRVASLLEVGTGFHPELTGRENIYLNGAILGMSRQEIRSKYDEIVDFAEVEKFLDTPVKRYSSGMYVRLAFAVAAHLEPEILVVDEVLAVGDASFQKKCLGKMEDVADNEGRTILFVSHQMNAIERLCIKCILLDKGSVVRESRNVSELIASYLSGDSGNSTVSPIWASTVDRRFANPYFMPERMFITTDRKKLTPHTDGAIRRDTQIFLVIEAKIEQRNPLLTIGYDIYDEQMNLIYRSYQTDQIDEAWPLIDPPIALLLSELPCFLNESTYYISLRGGLHCRRWLFSPTEETPTIQVSIKGGLSQSSYWYEKRPGIIAPIIRWENLSS